MKGNTLNKLQEGDPEKNSRKEDVLNIHKELFIPLNKLIGWCPNYEKPKEYMNKLR